MRPGIPSYGIATWTATLALCGGFASVACAQDAQKPNILFIVSDDTGYGDLGPYGGGDLVRGHGTREEVGLRVDEQALRRADRGVPEPFGQRVHQFEHGRGERRAEAELLGAAP